MEALHTPVRLRVPTATVETVSANTQAWTPSWGTVSETPWESPGVSGSTPCDIDEKFTQSVQSADEARKERSPATFAEAKSLDDETCSVFTWSKPLAIGLLQNDSCLDKGSPQTDVLSVPDYVQISQSDLDHTVAVNGSHAEDAEDNSFDLQEALPRTSGALQELRLLSQNV
eukprot:CAMPEP_0169211782 /NCGR_PEP_ID=MMETSP1016-20121227/15938_1 /TAXON_ID=342587 /ORGANISM="Karlodinium micrum, Strain CCMP2283" /LENGTH=171 /DNA_ID=CAMNT_0009289425 /DNA_START=67 /DNA_END=579 /DNA_ORIENTATION=-